jgi:hypothetical protein
MSKLTQRLSFDVQTRCFRVTVCVLTLLLASAFAAERQGTVIAGARRFGNLPTTETPESWADAAANNEVAILQQQGTFSVRYDERKIDNRGETLRAVIESKQGSVARLVERNGKPLTAAEDTAEKKRLQDAIERPEEFSKHHRRDNSMRDDAIKLIKMMPNAMLYTYAPDQPQPAGATAKQVVLDFKPNPEFHPPTMLSELLTGLEGRVWIDEETKHVTRAEGRVLHVVNFGFGVVARIYPGGSIVFEQTNVGGGHWVFSHLDEHLVVRALMVKTLPENSKITATDFTLMPAAMPYQDAIRMLLAQPISMR